MYDVRACNLCDVVKTEHWRQLIFASRGNIHTDKSVRAGAIGFTKSCTDTKSCVNLKPCTNKRTVVIDHVRPHMLNVPRHQRFQVI